MNKQAYYDGLPKKQMAAEALFFNDKGELLILHPTYKNRFEIPGGIVKNEEAPKEAVEREIEEEIGLSEKVKQLLVCDYWHPADGRPDNLQFIFYGGILSEEQINNIQLEEKEIGSFEFVSVTSEKDKKKLSKRQRVGPRVILALEALEKKQNYYLEDARKPN